MANPEPHDELERVLGGVGPRLKALLRERDIILAGLGAATGISVSTLSRLESGQRKANLELLLPLARAYQVPLDDLIAASPTHDPRVHARPITWHGMTMIPLSTRAGGLQAYKWVIRASRTPKRPDPQLHDGYEWLYVLSGRLRLVLGEHDLTMGCGEAAGFHTRVPHWFSNAGSDPVEVLALFGPQGERMHVRARPKNNVVLDA